MPKVNWNAVALNLPTMIGIAMSTIEAVKAKQSGPEKEAAAIAGIKTGLAPAERIFGDFANDDAFDTLLVTYIQARVALQNFVTKKTAEGVIVPPAA